MSEVKEISEDESELEEEIEEIENKEETKELAEEVYDEDEEIKKHRLMQFLQQRSQNQGSTLGQAREIPQETALEQSIASAPISSSSNDKEFIDYSKNLETENKAKYTSMSPNALTSQRQGGELPQQEFLDPMQSRGFESKDSLRPETLSPQDNNPNKKDLDEKKYDSVEMKKMSY